MTPKPTPSHDPDAVLPQDFDVLLAEAQPRLRGYIASLLGAWAEVDDLVQETNLVLIAKRETFEPGTNFIAWAFRVAYFKATTWRRDSMREGRVMFREHAFQELAAEAEAAFAHQQPLEIALADCLRLLSPDERALVDAKYVARRPLVELAAMRGCSANSLHQKISRIRLALRKCLSKLHPNRP